MRSALLRRVRYHTFHSSKLSMMRLLERRCAETAVGDRDHLLDEAVHQIGAGEEGFGVVRVVVEIGVQRDPFDMVEACARARCAPTRRRSAWCGRRSRRRRARSRGRSTSSSSRPRPRCARIRQASSPPSATARPSRCRGTRTSRRAAAPRRARGAGRRARCRRDGCSIPRCCAPHRRRACRD